MWQPYIEVVKDQAVLDKTSCVNGGARPGPTRRDSPEGAAAQGADDLAEESLEPHRGQAHCFNLKINRAYLLKELFRHFWEYRRGGWAAIPEEVVLVGHWNPCVTMLRRHDVPIDNGTVGSTTRQRHFRFRTAKN